MADVAYIRVSGSDQNMDRQLADCGVDFLKTFTDQASGSSTDRPGLQNCLEYLREGDTLHVHGIDRLARSLHDLQTLVARLVDKGVAVRFHAENMTFASGDKDPFATLLLQVLGSFAEFERNMLRERQREGIAKAKQAGKYAHGKGGRKRSVDRNQILQLRRDGVSVRKIAARVGCSPSSVQRALKEA